MIHETDTPRTMTPTQINKRIAIACGWKPVTHPGLEGFWEDPKELGFAIASIANYHGDLNAMHEAEGTLSREKWDMYELKVGWITGERGFRKINATAAQRAEAFLQAVGKWENDK